MVSVATGAQTGLWFEYEDAFAGEVTGDQHGFGHEATLDTDDGQNNAIRVFAPDTKDAVEVIAQNFSGSYSASFVLSEYEWLNFVFGEADDSGTDELVWETATAAPQPTTITEAFRNADFGRRLKGCVPANVSVNSNAPGQVEVSVNGAYADEEPIQDIGALGSQPTLDFEPLNHFDARLGYNGEKASITQSVGLSFQITTQMIDALDSRTPVDFWSGAYECDINWSRMVTDETQTQDTLENFYGTDDGSGVGDWVPNDDSFAFDVEHSGDAGTPDFAFAGSGGLPDSYSHSSVGDPQQPTSQEVNDYLTGMEITVDTSAVGA